MRWLAVVLALGLCLPGAARSYPIAKERELGERFSIEAASMLPLVRETEVVVFLDLIGQKIVRELESPQPFEYRFHVVRDPQLNAFAVPGGFIYIHSGLVTRTANDSELGGVVGHEIAHTHAHHIVRQQQKSALANYGALAGMILSAIQPALGAAALGASASVQLKYQREFEQEADYMGLRFMRKAGFDPHGMPRFMKRILEEQRSHPLEVPPYMLSHPLTDERITNLEATTRNLDPIAGSQRPSFALERVQAIIFALTGDHESVRRTYRDRAKDGRGWVLYGLVLLHQGDGAAAVDAFANAKEMGQRAIEADVGLAQLRAGRIAEATTSLRAAVEADPDDARARAHLGEALLRAGDFDGARRELLLAVERVPVLDEAEFNLGQAYGRGGDAGRGMFHLARAFEMRGDVERSLSHYERAAKQLPEDSAEAISARERTEKLGEIMSERILSRRQPR